MILPFYTYEVEEDDNIVIMDCNSLVDIPAHMKPMIAFKDQRATMKKDQTGTKDPVYRIFSEEERLVMGVLISAGTPIYRNDDEVGEYYGVFKKHVITKIKERFMKQNLMHNMNLMHNGKLLNSSNVFMVEIFQIDSKRGIQVPETLKSQNLQDGTLIGTYKILDDEVWTDIKKGKFKGFSIEAYLGIKEAKLKKQTMRKKTKLARGKFGKVSEISKWDVLVDQDSFEVGEKLTTTWKDGENEPITNPLNDGEYMTEDGRRILVDSDGIIRIVFNKQSNMKGKNNDKGDSTLFQRIFGKGAAAAKKFATATDMDGTVLSWEGELAEGTAMMVVVNEENSPAPAGEYQLTMEDGSVKMVTVDDAGLVTSIADVEEMTAMEVLDQVAEVMKKVLKAQAEKFEAQEKRIDQLQGEIDKMKDPADRKKEKHSGGRKPAAGGGGKLSLQEIMRGGTDND